MLDETGREMHGSWGNMISAEDAFNRMGADVMRWQFCQQPPWQDLLFGFKPGQEIQRKLLTLWNSLSFFVQYANVAGFTPRYEDLDRADANEDHSMDRWVQALTQRFVADATAAYEEYLTVNVLKAFDQYIDDLSNWYIRRSRRRFWNSDPAALRTLWVSLVQGLRVVAPIMPFLTEHMWQRLVVDVCPDAPASVFLAGWPAAHQADDRLLAEVAAMRQVIELGRRARSASKLPLRQPLARLVIDGVSGIEAYTDEIAEELRVKSVTIDTIEATQIKVRPNLSVLGPRLGSQVTVVRKALENGEFEQLADGSFVVAGLTLAPSDVLVERIDKEGWAVASDEGVTDDLRLEGRVYDVIHTVNSLRKTSGLEITDRIDLVLPTSDADLLDHRDWIAAEVLAVSITAAGSELSLAKSSS
jgi:isoleucyl-tRNA synthetase